MYVLTWIAAKAERRRIGNEVLLRKRKSVQDYARREKIRFAIELAGRRVGNGRRLWNKNPVHFPGKGNINAKKIK